MLSNVTTLYQDVCLPMKICPVCHQPLIKEKLGSPIFTSYYCTEFGHVASWSSSNSWSLYCYVNDYLYAIIGSEDKCSFITFTDNTTKVTTTNIYTSFEESYLSIQRMVKLLTFI